MSPGIDTGSSANNDWYDVYPDGRLIHRKTGKHIMTAALPVTNLLDPPCAEVTPYGAIGCGRCHALPGQDCLDTAARAAQEALRVSGAISRDNPQPPETPNTLRLPWTTDGKYGDLFDSDGTPIAKSLGPDTGDYITLAANHHAALVEALENVIDALSAAKFAAAVRDARALLERIRAGGGG